ncbi:glutaredoxin-like protein NrdH [Kocuria sp. cx-455]|uniref:glutaredoxin-like protein NrdH n=1 Tax=Kocuria sp. cx-455 TaxID=2771377 RepID=UPI001684A010|nr:glutaredoxin-like protein NrdH [Kocuria sp. cx-455]MBD2766228.1 glutaredoxin-like protein NrdH [Kocuria sp. cx-455]
MPVIVYSKPSCVQCNATYRAMNKKGVPYTVVDVTQDQTAYQHIVDLGYQQVPVVETEHEHWSGYRPDKITTLAS